MQERSVIVHRIVLPCAMPCYAARAAPPEGGGGCRRRGRRARGTFAVGTPGATPHVFNKDAICQWTAIGRGLAQHRGSGLVCHGNLSLSLTCQHRLHGLPLRSIYSCAFHVIDVDHPWPYLDLIHRYICLLACPGADLAVWRVGLKPHLHNNGAPPLALSNFLDMIT